MGHVTEPVAPLMGNLLVLSRAEPAECSVRPGLQQNPSALLSLVAPVLPEGGLVQGSLGSALAAWGWCHLCLLGFLLRVTSFQLPGGWQGAGGEAAVLLCGEKRAAQAKPQLPSPAHSGRFGRARERSKQLQVCVGWRFLPDPHEGCPLPQEFPACFCP